jgi:hydroxylamine reductase
MLAQALGMFWGTCDSYASGTGCARIGVCGKSAGASAIQDLLLHAVKGLSLYAAEARPVGVVDEEVDETTCRALSSTLASANFDPARLVDSIHHCVALRARLKDAVAAAGGNTVVSDPSAEFIPAADPAVLVKQGEAAGVISAHDACEDVQSLQQVLAYGIQGVAAFADQARMLGWRDERIHAFIQEGMAALVDRSLGVDDWLGWISRCGGVSLRALELLDAANTGSHGHPVPTAVRLGHVQGKCVLVSGHDLGSLADLLRRTEGTGIHVYTHGEMLAAHGYPELKKFEHLVGHFGAAWQKQKVDFARFPGPILMSGGCLQEPQPDYSDRFFTYGSSGWPGVAHLREGELGPIIAMSAGLPGFAADEDGGSVMVGFGRNAMLGKTDELVEAMRSGAVRHLFLVGGCDGTKARRNYYDDLVVNAPQDAVVLALGCGKLRFFERALGRIGGIPRLLDVGQCNDAYSAIQVLTALGHGLECDVNDLPLSVMLSWYGQRTLAILLTLLHLGVKHIRLGPSLPVFISPKVLDILAGEFDMKLITTADQDLAAAMSSSRGLPRSR